MARRRPLLRDRRGVTAMTFAIMSIALLGVIGLAAEAGGWIMIYGNIRATADGAAIAAALGAYAVDPTGTDSGDAASAASDAATDALNRNGYSAQANTTLAVSTQAPPATGDTDAGQVEVTTSVTPLIASMFGITTQKIGAQSIATLVPIFSACVLATSAPLVVSAPQTSPNCAYAANDYDVAAIDVTDASGVAPYAFVTAGDCVNCPAAASPGRPLSAFQPLIADPYTGVQTALQNKFNAGNVKCLNQGDTTVYNNPATYDTNMVPMLGNSTVVAPAGGMYYGYCNDFTPPAGTRVIMTPGVYLFFGAAFTVTASATVECQLDDGSGNPCDPTGLIQGTGVALLFTGNPATTPNLSIAATANVALSPPSGNDTIVPGAYSAFYPALAGVLIWRDGTMATGSSGSPVASIEASNPYSFSSSGPPVFTALNGIMYFPNAFVEFGANNAAASGTPQIGCDILVAGGITLDNLGSNFLDCAPYGLTAPQVLSPRLVNWGLPSR